nr:hypothetical protein [Tanacetum cinerariifolium]
MEKSWMRTSRTKKQYIDGVEAFLKYAVHNLQKMRNIDPRDADKPLYKGCPDFTKLSAIVKLLNLKGKYGASDKFFTELLGLLKKMLPAGNEMVKITYQAKQLMRMMGSGYKKIHICSNNCILYWKDNKELTVCPTCGISRWKVDNKTHKVYENILAEVQHIENKRGKGKRTNSKTSENQEDMRGRCGKILKQKRKITEEEGSSNQVNKAYWKKFNIWYRKLRYWRHNSVPHCIDFMHVENNVCESLVETLLNVPGKTKDGMNAQLDLAELGIKPELFARQEEDKTTLPPAGYTLTNAKKYIFCEMLSNIRDGKPLSADKSNEVSREVFQKAHLYAIHNTYETVPYFERHKQVLKTKNPSKRIALLENEHSKSFAKWLREEVERESAISKVSVSETIRWISYGPRATIVKYEAYNINGYTFYTKSNDGIVYQNSRVSDEAVDLHISKEVSTTRKAFYYGVLQEI